MRLVGNWESLCKIIVFIGVGELEIVKDCHTFYYHGTMNCIPLWKDWERRTAGHWMSRKENPQPSTSLLRKDKSQCCSVTIPLGSDCLAFCLAWVYSLLQLSFCSHIEEQDSSIARCCWHLFILGSKYFQLYISIFITQKNIINKETKCRICLHFGNNVNKENLGTKFLICG